MHEILLTCPPMIGMVSEFEADFARENFNVTIPTFTQEMTEDDLCEIMAKYDGWIIGDDPASRKVLEAGVLGRLKGCMRWGVGTNNVDFEAFKDFGIPIENTPGVFGAEVADLAIHYVIGLARQTFAIDIEVKKGNWYKPIGLSLWASKALIVGMGDIGKSLAKRLQAHDVDVSFYDPYVPQSSVAPGLQKTDWPNGLSEVDFVIFTAPLTEETHHLFNEQALECSKKGIKVINVGRGPLVDEAVLLKGLKDNVISTAALDVFEIEPVSTKQHKDLLSFKDRLILGSHNGSNTRQAVVKVSKKCIVRLGDFLNGRS